MLLWLPLVVALVHMFMYTTCQNSTDILHVTHIECAHNYEKQHLNEVLHESQSIYDNYI
jgi:hypothetical protein